MPVMLGENTKTATPATDRGAVTLIAQILPENGGTGMAPAQDPGDSLERNILEPAGQYEAPPPLSESPVPAGDSGSPKSQGDDALVFVPNQGAAFTAFIDSESLDGLKISGGALDDTESGIESTEDPIHDDFLPVDMAAIPNRAPSAEPQTVTTDEESAVSGTVTAADPDGDLLTFSLASGPASGTAVVNADGTFTYAPGAVLQSLPAGGSATDSFTVMVDDGHGGMATTTVTVTINGVNDAPVTADITVAGDEDGKISGTAVSSDIDGDKLAHSLDSGPSLGSVIVNTDGSFEYTPDASLQSLPVGASAIDSFTVLVDDGKGGTATSTVTVTINGVNDAPVVVGESFIVSDGTPFTVPASELLANDTDIEGEGLSVTAVGNMVNASASLAAGSVTFSGTSAGAGFFDYTVSDVSGGESVATVSLTVLHTDDGDDDLIIPSVADTDALIEGRGGNDRLTAGGGDDTLLGGLGNDTLSGGAGTDSLAGGMGDDSYVVDDAADKIAEFAGQGTDTVLSSVAFTIAPLPETENLTLTGGADINGTGNDGNNVVTGNSGKNSLSGGIGNDTLEGGAGIDSLVGGTGNDVFVVDTTTDVITELAGGGTDMVQSSVTFSISALAQIENLTLTGAASINGTGNNLNNVITGNSGNNALNGGNGVDTLIGGAGNDTYRVNTLTDKLVENAGEGTDTVSSSVTFDLKSVANIENLTLTGSAALNGTGDDNNNSIIGNTGANLLIGNGGDDTITGGAGADTMRGGLGNDVYVIGTTFVDVLEENPGEGSDTVNAQMTFNLTAVANIENLTLVNGGSFNGFGDGGDNRVTGNSGNNILEGRGGNDTLTGAAGTDTLIGGNGNDVYVVDSTGDSIAEAAGEGTDRIESSVTYTIAALANVENLTLTGTGNINGTGNAGDNIITGNAGNNKLSGGLGADTLIGGNGNDVYDSVDAADSVVEAAGGGTDRIESAISFSLAGFAEVENLTLTGSANVDGTGNGLNNRLIGNGGNNVLNGGAGSDTMTGGAGSDTYFVDSAGDSIVDSSGTDSVQSSITFNLSAFAGLEHLTLTGAGDINGTGSSSSNVLTGNDGNNVLDGQGNADTLIGGDGNDTIIGGAGNDRFDGGLGADALNFGQNKDTAVFTSLLEAGDIVTGFGTSGSNQDFINLDGLFDGLGVAAGARAGRVTLIAAGADTQLWIDSDGDTVADVQLLTFIGISAGLTVGTAATSDIQVGS